MWEAIQYVTSGLTLVAFLVMVIAWTYKSKTEERERLIKTASADKRADLVRSALEFFDVDTGGLTKEHKYELALMQIHARAQRFRTTAIVVCVIALILAGVSAYAISRSSSNPSTQNGAELKTPITDPKACRDKSHGIEKYGKELDVTRTSRWMSGGYSQDPWCNDVIGQLKGEYPEGDFNKVSSSEKSRSTCKPLKCMEYQYTCTVHVKTDPIYFEKVSSACK